MAPNFVTWDWTFDRKGVCQGHYYENYFVREVMDSVYPITERKKLLEGASSNIEYAVNDLDELINISNQKELEAGMGQGQAMQ